MPDSRQRRWTRLYPALGVAALAVGAVVVIRACGADGEPEQPHPTELGYPPAPEQELPDHTEVAEELAEASSPVPQRPITELVDPAWAVDTSERTGIPPRAVLAYAGAAIQVHHGDPDCGLGWNTLAGIGQVESIHGFFGDSSLGEDGVVDPPVIGIPLDGSEGLMEIPDTDGGELDGDDEWDRAVGPMQFIPTTWERYATDATGSGEPDVQHIDDAALTAALYLCDSADDLTTDQGWVDAVMAYNQSVAYVNEVAEFAEEYRSDG